MHMEDNQTRNVPVIARIRLQVFGTICEKPLHGR